MRWLLQRFKSLRWRGIGLFLAGALALLFLMAASPKLVGTLWLGVVALGVAIVGLLDALALETQGGPAARALFASVIDRPRWSLPRYTMTASLVLLFSGLAFLLWQGPELDLLPWVIVVALMPLALTAWFSTAWFVFVIASLLLLPCLGAFGLVDPWETHYGEVAREILARDDWISLWWAQDKWFWSKPILIFWLEALSLGLFGIDVQPDANPAHPEWAIRFPHYVLSIAALMAVYLVVARYWKKRTGVLCALVLLSCPYFFLISHQAITDLPLVTLMTITVCLLTLGLNEDPQQQVKPYSIGPWKVTAQHVVIAAVSAVALPQILYLASRNLAVTSKGVSLRADTFLYGSAGNSGVPGNPVHETMHPVFGSLAAQPLAQAVYWALGFALVIWVLRRQRHTQALIMYGFYLCCALGLMAKGLPGVLLPGLISLFYLMTANRWNLLLDGKLRIASGGLLVIVCSAPWFVAMHVRHGSGFLDRILVHDHLNRLASGVHGDTGTVQYFIEQLGTGLFPWVAWVPAAVAYGLVRVNQLDRAPEPVQRTQNHVLLLWGLWLVCGFALFSAMVTKFHHYAFPVVPPTALMIGIAVDRLLGSQPDTWAPRQKAALGVLTLASIAAVVAAAGWFGQIRGVIPRSVPVPARADYVLHHALGLGWIVVLVCISLMGFVLAWRWLDRGPSEAQQNNGYARWAALCVGAILLAFVGRDLSWVTDARPAGYERFMWLFIYRYERPWPTQFDYRPILTGFSLVFVLLLLGALWQRIRTLCLFAFIAGALAFSVWGLDVYLMDVAPHWTQRHLVKRYYALRKGPHEPLVSWQMNWKGETFYTGNRIPAFIDMKDKEVRDWLNAHRHQRVFFLLEPTRLASFRRSLKRPIQERSTMDDCNKFVLVSAEPLPQTGPSSQ